MEPWDLVLDREIRRAARVAVIGIGNITRGDDAAGTLAARRLLLEPAGVPAKALVVAAEEAPENFTGVIRAFGPDLVITVDVTRAGQAPGTVFLFDPVEVVEEDVSAHRIPLTRLVRYIRETMGCRVLLVGIEPVSLTGTSEKLSRPVARAVRIIVETIRRALATG